MDKARSKNSSPLGPSPPPSSPATTKTMKANKGKDTNPELILRRALREAGYPGYRLHWKKIPGRPDIAYPSKKIAIFVNGCFWHRCPRCNLPLPKRNREFWRRKFYNNKKRDKHMIRALKETGWTTIELWECEINHNIVKSKNKVIKQLKKAV